MDIDDSTKQREVNVDEYLEHVGQFGRFQIISVLLFCVLIVPSTYQSLIVSFTNIDSPWRCVSTNQTESGATRECLVTEHLSYEHDSYNHRCMINRSSWEFTQPEEYSIITDWDLVCDQEYLSYLSSSALFIGWAFGDLIFGWLSDRYGRKFVLFPSWTGLVLSAFATGFVNNIYLFITLRILTGFLQGGVLAIIYVMSTELVGPKYRSLAGTMVWISYTLALCMMGVQAWLVPRWKTLLIITSIPYIIFLASFKFIPESVRWLRVNGKLDEATAILNRVARVNNVKINEKIKLSQVTIETCGSASFIHLFSSSSMAITTLLLSLSWFTNGQVYYGISLASDQLGGNLYRDFILTSLVEMPATLLVIYCTNKFGRKPTVNYSMIINGAACIAIALIPTHGVHKVVRISLGMVGKLCISLSYSALYVWSVELYPTVLRSKGIAIISVSSNVGAASAPWIVQYLRTVHYVLPFTIMGALSLVSALLCFKLKETLGMATAETLTSGDQTNNGATEMKLGQYNDVSTTKL